MLESCVGGHTAEMLVLLQKLGTTERRSRAYVVAATDSLSAQKAERHERSLQSSKRASSVRDPPKLLQTFSVMSRSHEPEMTLRGQVPSSN